MSELTTHFFSVPRNHIPARSINTTQTPIVTPPLTGEPLAFIHCALLDRVAPDLAYIRDRTGRDTDGEGCQAAVFYSISSTQPALQVVTRVVAHALALITCPLFPARPLHEFRVIRSFL